MKNKTNEQKYKRLDDIEYVLLRPGVYIGSTKLKRSIEWLYDENTKSFTPTEIDYNPAFVKLFDEILSNSIDESKRNPLLNKIEVNIDNDSISVTDNGGIPVAMHKEYKEWIPELLFSNLKAGSNFDDSEERVGIGMNGMGSTLTNIFSTEFIVKTADGKKQFEQTFSNNMNVRTKPVIVTSTKKFTTIQYSPDYTRLSMSGLDDIHKNLLRIRVMGAAACNINLKFYWNGERIQYKSFKEYMHHFVNSESLMYEKSEKWDVGVTFSNNGFQQISFVNSTPTKNGGTHVNYITNQVVEKIREFINKKHKVDLKPNNIKNHLMVFVNATINNPSFNSQTKEDLITEVRDFGSTHIVSEKLLKQVLQSEIVQSILDWIQEKKNADEKALLRKVHSDIKTKNIPNFMDAKATRNRDQCILGIFEGLSAKDPARKFRDPMKFGAFPIQGKFVNVSKKEMAKIVNNDEVIGIMGALGLQFNKPAENLRYGKIYIFADSDYDGNCITALLINFFATFWPELFDQKRIYRAVTPIRVATKGKESISFYTNEEFDQWAKKNDVKKWEISFKKGLGALTDSEYKEIIDNPRVLEIVKDDAFKESLSVWFDDSSEPRQLKLTEYAKSRNAE